MVQYWLKSFGFSIRIVTIAVMLLGTVFTVPAHCGTWRVIPIRLEFNQRTRSGVVTITNDSDDPISFNVEAREWTQDPEGKDVYSETSDILFFPKSLTIDPHSQKIIRAGIKVPALDREKTYRLFIKQEAPPQERSTTTVAIAIRFGLPIFAKPLTEEIRGEVVEASIREGRLTVEIKNSGNAHFRVNSLQLEGKDANGAAVLSQAVNGAYLLAGSERAFTALLPGDQCNQMDRMTVEVLSDRIQLSEELKVDQTMCSAP